MLPDPHLHHYILPSSEALCFFPWSGTILSPFTVSPFIPRFRLRPSPIYNPWVDICVTQAWLDPQSELLCPIPLRLCTGLASGSRAWQCACNKPLSLLPILLLFYVYKSYLLCPSLTSESSTCPSRTLSRLSTVQSSSNSICPSRLIHLSTLKRPRSGVGLT